MPESLVQVTSGGGPKLHTYQRTIGANNVEDEVVVNGEPYLASYVAVSGASTTAAGATHWQLMAGASLNVYVRRIWVYQAAAATTAAIVPWTVQRLTTAGTGGTASTPVAYDTSDAACGATFMAIPTVKGTESVVLGTGYAYMVQTVAVSMQPGPSLLQMWDWSQVARSKCPRIAAGAANGIMVSNRAAVAGATVIVQIEFSEANF